MKQVRLYGDVIARRTSLRPTLDLHRPTYLIVARSKSAESNDWAALWCPRELQLSVVVAVILPMRFEARGSADDGRFCVFPFLLVFSFLSFCVLATLGLRETQYDFWVRRFYFFWIWESAARFNNIAHATVLCVKFTCKRKCATSPLQNKTVKDYE
jgi:hypothetical protein